MLAEALRRVPARDGFIDRSVSHLPHGSVELKVQNLVRAEMTNLQLSIPHKLWSLENVQLRDDLFFD